MFDVLGDINWLAVILGTLAYYILGALWFTPLFGKLYDKALGKQRAKGQKWPLIYYIGPLVSCAVVTIATTVLLYALHVDVLSEALTLGLIVGVGYLASISFNNAITPNTPRPLLYGAVTGSYHIAGVLIVAAIIFGLK